MRVGSPGLTFPEPADGRYTPHRSAEHGHRQPGPAQAAHGPRRRRRPGPGGQGRSGDDRARAAHLCPTSVEAARPAPRHRRLSQHRRATRTERGEPRCQTL